MAKVIGNVIISALVIITVSYLLPGFHVDSVLTALVVALVLGVLNTFVKPILIFLTLPINLITFGLFILVINTFLLVVADQLISGLEITSFGMAFVASILISIFSSFLNRFK